MTPRFKTTLKTGLLALTLGLAGAAAWAAGPTNPLGLKTNILFILDSSGSMWAQIEGKAKVDTLPPDADMGLLTFGHRKKGDCKDIELVAPIGAKKPEEIKAIANALQPKGNTPLSAALMQAADAFKGVNGAKMIVLITDGGEECEADPCAVARKLALSGLVVRVNVIGFAPTDAEREQLQCIAKEGTGR